MSHPVLALFILALCLEFRESMAACTAWQSISPSNYSTTYAEANSPNANSVRPLGYMSMTVPFHREGTERPCVTVANTAGNGRHYEVNLDIGPGTICVIAGQADPNCYSDRGTTCGTVADGNSMTFQYECKSCEGSAVTFWYRIVLEELPAGTANYNENWCQTRNADYPRGLKSTGEVLVIPTPPGNKPGGGAVGRHFSGLNKLLCTVLAIALMSLLF